MISVTMVGHTEVVARLRAFTPALQAVLNRRIWALVLRLEARVKNKLSGEVLNVRTGALRRSIHSTVVENGSIIKGRVASSGDVKYARIHEYGGRTKAHIIEARNGKALRFASAASAGGYAYAQRVNHPGSRMPERSFLRSSLRDMREEITRSLAGAPAEAIGKQ